MQTHVLMEQKLLNTVRSAVEQALQENNRERNKLEMDNPTIMSEPLHRLEHSLAQENHSLRTMLLTLSGYQRAVAKSLELRSLAFQELALSGNADSDQVPVPRRIVECWLCGAAVEQIG